MPPSPAVTRADRPLATEPRAWHAMPSEAVLAALEAAPHGLSEAEAERRLSVYGPNRLQQGKGQGALLRFLSQFHNLLIYVLLASGALAAAIGHLTDALVILAVVVANAVIGFVQEGRAEQALEAIRAMIDPRASVLRGGHRMTVPAE